MKIENLRLKKVVENRETEFRYTLRYIYVCLHYYSRYQLIVDKKAGQFNKVINSRKSVELILLKEFDD